MICDSLVGQDGSDGTKAQEGGDMCYLRLIHSVVQRKPRQHCKTVILQLKFL